MPNLKFRAEAGCLAALLGALVGISIACSLFGQGAVARQHDPILHRWFYVSQRTKDDAAVERLQSLIETAASHGCNGMVLHADWDDLLKWPAESFDYLQQVKVHCQKQNIQLIPLLLSAGYGYGVVNQNPNLVSGIPVREVAFSVQDGVATLNPDRPISQTEGGFENLEGHTCSFFSLQDEPGETTVVDRAMAYSGRASLRINSSAKGRQRIAFDLTQPYKHYVVRFWARSKSGSNCNVTVSVYDQQQQRKHTDFPVTQQWTKIETTVATLDRKPRVWIGSWKKEASPIWIDDLEVVESGLANVLRRTGTPVVVRNAKTEVTYFEGKDYLPIIDPLLEPRGLPHESPAIELVQGGRIAKGDQLAVSAYVPILLRKKQPVLSIAEPEVYEIWERVVSRIQREIAPSMWFLDVDEVRGGCTDEAAKKLRNQNGQPMTSGEILGMCITRQYEMILRANPNAEVAIWSDMIDPNHNAKPYYYTVPGGYAGSWEHIPRELIVVCWWLHENTDRTLDHFSGLGFRVLAGAYYDADNLENCRRWIDHLRRTPTSVGIMYTTWENKYELLAPFGDLVMDAKH